MCVWRVIFNYVIFQENSTKCKNSKLSIEWKYRYYFHSNRYFLTDISQTFRIEKPTVWHANKTTENNNQKLRPAIEKYESQLLPPTIPPVILIHFDFCREHFNLVQIETRVLNNERVGVSKSNETFVWRKFLEVTYAGDIHASWTVIYHLAGRDVNHSPATNYQNKLFLRANIRNWWINDASK